MLLRPLTEGTIVVSIRESTTKFEDLKVEQSTYELRITFHIEWLIRAAHRRDILRVRERCVTINFSPTFVLVHQCVIGVPQARLDVDGIGEGREEVRKRVAGPCGKLEHGRVSSSLRAYPEVRRRRYPGIELAQREHEAAYEDRGHSGTEYVS